MADISKVNVSTLTTVLPDLVPSSDVIRKVLGSVDSYAKETAGKAVSQLSNFGARINPFGSVSQIRPSNSGDFKDLKVCGIVGTNNILNQLFECEPSAEVLLASLSVLKQFS